VKLRITGHGADQFNCAEFCENTAYLKVNGSPQFERSIWRSDCALNPLYPQGGTWIFQRANWCPGAEVTTFDWDISPLITPGDSAELDLDLEYYAGSTSGWANYVTETQLITYGPPNYSLDAEVYDIISPSNNQMYKRRNPVCNNPLIVIRNNGTTPLTSATITYGREGAPASVYEWTGNLPFLDTAHVRLGAFLLPDQSNSSRFTATISNPNGGNDENAYNDAASTEFTFPPQYPPHLVVELKTNYRPGDNAYTITDDQGNVVLSKSGFASNAVHKDTILLPDGCYTFRLTDSGEDGLYFWFYPSFGSGYLRLRNADANSAIVKSFGADFGAEVYHEFTVGFYVNTPDPQPSDNFDVSVYPNPAADETIIDVALTERSDAVIVLTDLAGKEIFRTAFRDILKETFPVDLRRQPTGIYLLHVTAGGEKATKKIVVSR
jgi:hypothetical protein